ncbi:glucoamylase b [Spinellus fusiger]|nr:glucoamylase b [Spinellus fusiger]
MRGSFLWIALGTGGAVAAARQWGGWDAERYDTPSGNTSLDAWAASQESISLRVMLQNINPPNTKRGFVAASLSTHDPDYFYTWTRDAAQVARVLVHAYDTSRRPDLHDVLVDYVDFQVDTQTTHTQCQCLGEPKFNPDGSGFAGEWGRPQNDGPAERAITFLLLSRALSQKKYVATTLQPAIYRDLDYIVLVWSDPCFDLWEEVHGLHFYTLMVMRRALVEGMALAQEHSDTVRVAQYRYTLGEIEDRLSQFWSVSRHAIVATREHQGGHDPKPSGLDVSTVLAANLVADMRDGFYTPDSDEMLATVASLYASFQALFPINRSLAPHLGVAIGRYPEDVYDGHGTSRGNPWFLATTAYTEYYYHVIRLFKAREAVVVNRVNWRFFVQFDVEAVPGKEYRKESSAFEALLTSIAVEADKFLSTVQYHQMANGSLSEQYNRWTGFEQGARDLTWSHAAFITAIRARAGKPIP